MMAYNQPGLDIPCPGKNQLRPNSRDARPERGALKYAEPYRSVMDFGGAAGASPTFVASKPFNGKPKPVAKDAPIHPGISTAERSRKGVRS